MAPIFILAAAVAAGQLTPEDPKTGAVATGNEQRRCISWTVAKRTHGIQRRADEQWLWGLVTGFDLAGWRSEHEKLIWPSDTPGDYLDSTALSVGPMTPGKSPPSSG
jgi:hypothetical protein